MGEWFNVEEAPMEDVDLKVLASGSLEDLQISVESSIGISRMLY